MYTTDTLKKLIITLGALALLFVFGVTIDTVNAQIEQLLEPNTTINASGSLNGTQTQFTVNVDGTMFARHNNANCVNEPQTFEAWYTVLATGVSVNVSAGQFNGQSVPTTINPTPQAGTSCQNPGNFGEYTGTKIFNVSGLSNGDYSMTLKVTDNGGRIDTDQVSFTINNRSTVQAPTVTISASPGTITEGGSTTLTWATTNSPTSCTASGSWSGSKNVNGSSQTISNITRPTSGSRTYTITCSNSAGFDAASATVVINTAVSDLSCSASPSTVDTGQNVTFSATGGSGTYSWTGGGSPATGGNSSTFTTNYSSDGTKTATVTRGGVSAQCSVSVQGAETETDPLQCFPSSQTVNIGDSATFSLQDPSTGVFTGPSGISPTWSSPSAGRISSAGGGNAHYTIAYSTPGARTITVNRGGETDTCSLTVSNINPTGVHETASNSLCTVSGWAYDGDTPSTAPQVSVYSDNVLIDTLTTQSCSGGQCPFTYNLTGEITTGVQHSIKLKAHDTSTGQQFDLSGTPKQITCGSSGSTIGVDIKARKVDTSNYTDSLTVPSGSSIDLQWTTTGSPTSCSATPTTTGWSGSKTASGGTQSLSNITSQRTYNIQCVKGAETTNDSVTVGVTNGAGVTLKVGPSEIGPWSSILNVSEGEDAWIQWVPTNATSCTATASPTDSQWTGSKLATGGAQVQKLTSRIMDKYYGIECTGGGVTADASAQITVSTTAPTTGTIIVQSIDADTGAPVASDWTLSGQITTSESGKTEVTYEDMLEGGYNVTPGPAVPSGYTLQGVVVSSSQTLAGGSTRTFTIRYQSSGGTGGGDPLSCFPGNQQANTGENVTVTASGGGGSYYWSTNGDASPSSENSGGFSSFNTWYATEGIKDVEVTDGNTTASCQITVATSASAICSNGDDDDEDGFYDWDGAGRGDPDLDCDGPNDNSEAGSASDYTIDAGGVIFMNVNELRSGPTVVTVRSQGGFSENVWFSPLGTPQGGLEARTEGLPASTSAYFSDGNGSPNERDDRILTSGEYTEGVRFYVEATTPLALGDYPLTIYADANGIVRTKNIMLRVVTPGAGGSGTTTPIFEEF